VDVEGHLADEVGAEEHRTLEDAEGDQLASLELGADVFRHLAHALLDLFAAE
jgi:hypothetical protein